MPTSHVISTQNQVSIGGAALGRLVTVAIVAWVALAAVLGNIVSDGDEARTLLLLVLAGALPIWCCFRRTNSDGSPRVDLLQPGALLACLFYLYIVIPGFHVWRDGAYHSDWIDPTWPPARLYHLTLLVCILSLVAFKVGYGRNEQRLADRQPASVPLRADPQWPSSATALAAAMLAVGFPFRLYHLAAFGGPREDILLFLSPSYVAESGVSIGGVPTFLEAFFDWGALLLLFRAIITKKQRLLSVTVLATAGIFAYLLSGKRSAILPFLLYPITWIHYIQRRISIRRGLVYVTTTFLLVSSLLFMRTVGPLFVSQGFSISAVPAEIALQPARFYLNSPELAVFDMTMLAVQDRGLLLHEVGGRFWGGFQYNLAPAAYIIPRALWPDKPVFRDLGQVFFQHAVDVKGQPDVGFAVGIVGGLYIFGGVAGVLLGMVLIGALFRFIYERLQPWNRDPRCVFIYGIALWMIFHFLRFGTLGYTLIYFSQFELPGVIAAMLVLGVRKPVRKPYLA